MKVQLPVSNVTPEKTVSDNGRVERWSIPAGDSWRVYRIRAQVLPHLTGYVHLVLGPGFPPTLVDAGSGEGDCPAQILDGLDTVNRQFEPFSIEQIERIVLTHTHIDHFGGVNQLKRLSGAEVWVHRFESRIVSAYNERASVSNCRFASFCRDAGIAPNDIDAVLNGFGFLPGRVTPTHVDRELDDGYCDGPASFTLFSGHSAGGIVMAVGPMLFTGDLILSKTLTQIWPERLIPHTGLEHYLASMDQFVQLVQSIKKDTGRSPLVFPGHEDTIASPESRVELVKKSSFRRNQRILEILNQSAEPMTIDEIARRLYLTSHSSRTFFAICDVGARLEYMQLHAEVAVANYEDLSSMEYPVYRWRALSPML